MAQFSIEIADDDIDRVISAVCANYNYEAQIANPDFDPSQEESETNPRSITNPESGFQFANRMVRNFLVDHTVSHEKKQQRESLPEVQNPSISDPAV